MPNMPKVVIALLLALVAVVAGLQLRPTTAPGSLGSVLSNPSATDTNKDISSLTAQQNVVSYLQQHHRLPDYYITKKQARSQGWDARSGNLCQVLPGKAIGGDVFSNREGRLPNAAQRQWREADINYQCGHRQSDRLLYSNDGLIYVTTDHYQNMTRVDK